MYLHIYRDMSMWLPRIINDIDSDITPYLKLQVICRTLKAKM